MKKTDAYDEAIKESMVDACDSFQRGIHRPMATKRKRLDEKDIASTDLVKIVLFLCVLGLMGAFFTGEEMREESQFPCGSQ